MKAQDAMLETLQELGCCVRAFGGYRQSAVLTGGLVPYVYRHLPEFAGRTAQPALLTFDLDWTVPAPLNLAGETLDKQLTDSGFEVVLGGQEPPHVMRYQPARYGNVRGPVYVEFLTPRRGGVEVRGQDRTVLEVQAGLNAQALPYLALLLHAPLPFDASAVSGTGLEKGTQILLSDPMAYVVQKTLARNRRKPNKKGTDQAHIYDVVVLWRGRWPDMHAALTVLQDAGFPSTWFNRARENLANLYSSPESDGPIEVARVYNGFMGPGALRATTVHKLMQRFLGAIGWK
jgi:hypothetical protein